MNNTPQGGASEGNAADDVLMVDRGQAGNCSPGLSFPLFVLQQPLFAPEAATIADQGAIRAYDPVAGDDDGNGILIIGVSHSTIGIGFTDGPCHVSVGGQLAVRDLFQPLPDEFLKGRSLQKELEGEVLAGSFEILIELSNPLLHAFREIPVIGRPSLHKSHGHDALRGPGDLQGADRR